MIKVVDICDPTNRPLCITDGLATGVALLAGRLFGGGTGIGQTYGCLICEVSDRGAVVDTLADIRIHFVTICELSAINEAFKNSLHVLLDVFDFSVHVV